MKEFERIVAEQLTLHPSMQPRDLCKLCYQAAHGGEHLLTDLSAARTYLNAEFDTVTADRDLPLYEPISVEFVRVNLAAWKALGCKADDLFIVFAAGGGQKQEIKPLLNIAEQVWCQSGRSKSAFFAFISDYRDAGYPSLHHSEIYRQSQSPAYRVCRKSLVDDFLLKIKAKL